MTPFHFAAENGQVCQLIQTLKFVTTSLVNLIKSVFNLTMFFFITGNENKFDPRYGGKAI